MCRKKGIAAGRRFSNANDRLSCRRENPDIKLWKPRLECQRRKQPGSTFADDKDR